MNDIFEDLFKQDKTQTQSISVVMCVMDRSDNLHKAIRSCLKHPDVTEIIVLDYGSKTPFQTEYDSQKIKIYRIESPYWHLSKAYNIAIQLAKSDIIVKLDADYILLNNFFEHHSIKEKEYISGSLKNDPLCGFLMIHREDFLSINGYNERIISYGYDDKDINQRLEKHGLLKKDLDRNFIEHLKHNKKPEIWFDNNPFVLSNKGDMVNKNKKISNEYPWTKYDNMSSYTTYKPDISAVVCCMNRSENLLTSLKSWLDTNYFKEIIILDYGSKDPIKNIIPEYLQTEIVKIYRVEEKYWHLTKAYNIAIQLATQPIIAKLDCDYYLEKNFFVNNTIKNSSEFLSGNNNKNQSLWGFLMCLKKHFLFINGYNERIVGWGHDDIDINQRLAKIGLKMKTIEIDYIKHLSHTILGKNIFTKKQLSTKLSQEQNIQTMKEKPWSTSDIMSKFVN